MVVGALIGALLFASLAVQTHNNTRDINRFRTVVVQVQSTSCPPHAGRAKCEQLLARLIASATKAELQTLGKPGARGARGAQGPPGPPGPPGPAGANGTNGTDGAAGARGGTGATGATGATGNQGAPGHNGSNGIPGTPGTPGTPGVSVTVPGLPLPHVP